MRSIKKVVVCHVGARDKYSIATMFQKKGILKQLVTDFWMLPQAKMPIFIKKKMMRRHNAEIPSHKVSSYGLFRAVLDILITKIKKTNFSKWLFHDAAFSRFALKKIMKLDPDLIWTYSNSSAEIFEYFQNDSKKIKILNQIDPGLEYYKIKEKLWKEFPEYEEAPEAMPLEFEKRMKREWSGADIIIVNSDYSKKCLIKQGVDENKILIVPLIYDKETAPVKKDHTKSRLLIGFVGNINLIKGFKTFIDVAAHLSDKHDFIAIGENSLKEDVIKQTGNNIKYTGRLPYHEVEKMMKNMDVMVFPTHCDGFGMVQLEAMANGVVVLATDNCGEVVQHGENGFKIDSVEKTVSAIQKLDENREELHRLSNNAFERVKEFSRKSVENLISEKMGKLGLHF